MYARPKSQAKITYSFIFVASLFLVSSIILPALAQNEVNELDTLFETARGQLLGVYNSEVISHAGIIIGLMVAVASILPNAWKAFTHRKRILRFAGVFLPLLIILALFYSVGRLFFWSALSGALFSATKTNIGVTITSSNATYCMSALANYTISSAMNAPLSITSLIVRAVNSDNLIFFIMIGLVIITLISLFTSSKYDPQHKKENNQKHTQL
jgi:hypothetical protein